MSDSSKTATGSLELQDDGSTRTRTISQAMELVNQHFGPNYYGPYDRGRAGMLAVEAFQKGFDNGRRVAELAAELQGPVIKSLNAEVADYRNDCIRLSKALRHIDEITTGSLPLTYLIKEIIREALAGMPPF